MTMLAAAAAFFLAIHLLVSGTRVRDALTGALGEGLYMGVFSLASVAGLVWMAMAYNAAFATETYEVWDFGPGVRHLGIPVMFVALMIGVPGLLTPNPTSAGAGEMLKGEVPVSGLLRVTRHPFLWGSAIWAGFHMLANGDAASIIFFGTFLILTVLGTFSIDAKRRRVYGEAWGRFAQKTSNIPFAAILTGRNSLALGEIGAWRLLAALAVFGAILFAHAWAFSASPFPGGWVPF